MNQPSKKVAGFTLLELVVVVAIIGILASIALIPNLLRFQQRGAASAIKSHMEQIAKAMELAGVEGCTSVSGSLGGEMKCNTTGTVYIKRLPNQPSSGAQFDFDGTCGGTLTTSFDNVNPNTAAWTICATGFLDGGVFTCTAGSCACSSATLCQR